MKVLRGTLYPSIHPNDAMTQVILESDLATSMSDAVRSLETAIPGALVVTEVFEAESDVGLVEATVLAERRRRSNLQREMNMALLYHWDGEHLTRVSDDGVLSGTIPAPRLRERDVESVLKQLGSHPNYRHQRVVAISANGTMLEMKDGEVKKVGRS